MEKQVAQDQAIEEAVIVEFKTGETKQLQFNVSGILEGLAEMQLAPATLNALMVLGGGLAVKSVNPKAGDSLEMDMFTAAKTLVDNQEDVHHYMAMLSKIVTELNPLLETQQIVLGTTEKEWTVNGELLGEELILDITVVDYVEPERVELSKVMLDYTTLGLINHAEELFAVLGGIEDRERFSKLLTASHSHFTNNGRNNPLAVARDVLGNFYASLVAIKGETALPLALNQVTIVNGFIFDFVGLISVELQKASMAISEKAQEIVENGGNVQIVIKATVGAELKDDYFELIIEEVKPRELNVGVTAPAVTEGNSTPAPVETEAEPMPVDMDADAVPQEPNA